MILQTGARADRFLEVIAAQEKSCRKRKGKEAAMDFIEVIFGVSPDGASGSLEFLILMVPLVIVAMVVLSPRQRA